MEVTIMKTEYEAEAEIAIDEAKRLLDEIDDTAQELRDALSLHDQNARYEAIEKFVESRECDLNALSNPHRYLTFSADKLLTAITYREQAICNAHTLKERIEAK